MSREKDLSEGLDALLVAYCALHKRRAAGETRDDLRPDAQTMSEATLALANNDPVLAMAIGLAITEAGRHVMRCECVHCEAIKAGTPISGGVCDHSESARERQAPLVEMTL